MKPSPPPIDVEKVKDNCIKLERSIATLERYIKTFKLIFNIFKIYEKFEFRDIEDL